MQPDDQLNENKYLIYRLGNELYGSSLTSIKEVIKLGDLKQVPFMNTYFKGVMNLRGQIIGVIDLRLKFGLSTNQDETTGLIIVVETQDGLIGAIVDELDTVIDIASTNIENNPVLDTKIPMEFFCGVAKANDRLINIIDISGTISSEDYRTIKSNKKAA